MDKENKDSNLQNESIFGNSQRAQKSASDKDTYVSPLVEGIQKKHQAESERLKGNEAVKSKDFSEAVYHYTNSIDLNPKEAFTYANRSMAYLKQKIYANALMDASEAIKLKPGYLKAHHRRGKAYTGLGKYEEAIRDFQYILENEPENKDVNKDL
jgi:tetratricopeptide (TPR) repeat protein